MKMEIHPTSDFQITGSGKAKAWQKAAEVALTPREKDGVRYATRAKALYSQTGIYFLVDCEDQKLTCTRQKDFDHLYREDVVEVFLWPDEKQALYFEYEISPLGAELPILVANHQGVFHGWRPWVYEKDRKIRKATSVRGGAKQPGARVSGWSCEFFIPFALFKGLGNVPPKPGTKWRANLYRIDYDKKPVTFYTWAPLSKGTFHEYKRFGTFLFK